MTGVPELPHWMTWRRRTFPDANLLLLRGRHPALVDSGFVGHATDTVGWVDSVTASLDLVVNTHWHSDHVGANAVLQRSGAAIAASADDARAIARRDPGCCLAQYLDQPVAPYTVDIPLRDGQVVTMGEAGWEVVAAPGHRRTSGALAAGRVDPRGRRCAVRLRRRLGQPGAGRPRGLRHRPPIPAPTAGSRRPGAAARGLVPAHPTVAFEAALRRAQRLVDDPDGAVRYGARRIFAFALMIRGGLAVDAVTAYLCRRAWFPLPRDWLPPRS